MKNTFSFSPDSLTVNGWPYAAEYVEHDDGSVNIIVKLCKDDADRDALILVPADDPRRAAIMAALHPETAPRALAIVAQEAAQQTEPETPMEGASESPAPEEQTETSETPESAPEEQTETSADEAQNEPDPKETRGSVPEKPFIGTRIDGLGYSIFFNGEAKRTQIRFTGDANNNMIKAAEAAGFYYSKLTDTFNKRLTFKAYRAALALAASFNAA